MGFSGLAPTRAEREQDRRDQAERKRIKAMEAHIKTMEERIRELEAAIRDCCSDAGCFGNFDEVCAVSDEPIHTWCALCKLSTFLPLTTANREAEHE